MHRFKSYGQNKMNSEIMAISFVFWPYFGPKMTTPKEALPMVLREHLYIFGISRARGMRLAS